jgi:acyl-coenzyme A synthetase/AMP-(fatty) acid ligase
VICAVQRKTILSLYTKIVVVKKDKALMYFGHSFEDICAQIACIAALAISI